MSKLTDCRAMLDKCRTERAALQQRATILQGRNATLEAQVVDLKTRVAALGSENVDLRDNVNRLTAALEACQAKLPPPPPPPPPSPSPTDGMRVVFAPQGPADWKARLVERYVGGFELVDGWTEVWGSGPASLPGGRIELQDTGRGGAAPGTERYYEMEFYLAAGIALIGRPGEGFVTFNQFHGNDALDPQELGAGYTGGLALIAGTDKLVARVRGGKRLSTAGSHGYASEHEFEFGQLKRDTVHRIGWHCRWSHSGDGFVRAYLDGKLGGKVEGVATMSEVANNQMFRVGAYPHGIAASGLLFRYRNVRVWAP